jgi:L-serine dehydratase
LQHEGHLDATARVCSQLYGSLGATGKGHGSDKAVLLGLTGDEPDSVDVDSIATRLKQIRDAKEVPLLGRHPIAFNEKTDLVMYRRETLPFHANGMRFIAFDGDSLREISTEILTLAQKQGGAVPLMWGHRFQSPLPPNGVGPR